MKQNIIEATINDFEIFAKYLRKDLELSDHHRKIISALSDIKNKKVKRAIVTVPPQRGKSTLCSELFPVWILANNPNTKIIVASYSAELASKFCRQARDYINSNEFQQMFPHLKLRKDLDRQDFFGFEGQSGYFRSVGVGGSLTGYSADILIIDDPHKDRIDAESKRSRDGVYDWYTSVALTRLSPGGSIICIQTRWHTDDLSGRLLLQKGFKHLWIKAIGDDETDEGVCWKERYTLKDYLEIKEEVGTRDFEALYQGQPTSNNSGMFCQDYFDYYIDSPYNLQWVRAWDIASSKTGDYSVGALVAQDNYGNIYVEDIRRFQLEFPDLINQICSTAYEDGDDTHILIESFGIGVPAYQEVCRMLPGHIIRKSKEKGDKSKKAYVLATRAESGRLLLKRSMWNKNFIDEATSFPFGKNDDQVDACASAVNYLAGKRTYFDEAIVHKSGSYSYYFEGLATKEKQIYKKVL